MADQFLALLEKERPTIEQYIPSYFNKDLWMLNAKNTWKAIQANERLRACSSDSLVECITEAARRGLEINTANKHCALVAFGKTAVLLTQWQGRNFQWMKSGAIKKLKVDIAFNGDHFRVVSGDEDRIVHEPDVLADRSTAWRNNIENVIASYAIATLWSGQRVHSVCSRSYLKRIKDFIAKQKGESTFWRDWLPEMCMKTAVNRLDGKIQPPPDMTPDQMEAWSRAGSYPVETSFTAIDTELPPDDLPQGVANADVAQRTEQHVSTGTVAGSTPAIGADSGVVQPGKTAGLEPANAGSSPAPRTTIATTSRRHMNADEADDLMRRARKAGLSIGDMALKLGESFEGRDDPCALFIDELPAAEKALGL